MSELVLQLSSSRGEFVLNNENAMELVELAMRLLPSVIMEAFLGIALYRHFCTASVYVFSREWSVSLSLEPASIECGFVDIMGEREEYLIFLSGRELDSKEGVPMYEIYGETIINPVFCYEDKEEKAVKYDEKNEHTYVPYSEVKGNEFFCDSENGYKAWRELKEKLLREYSDLGNME